MHYLFYCAISLGCLLYTVFQNPHIHKWRGFEILCGVVYVTGSVFVIQNDARRARLFMWNISSTKGTHKTFEIFTTSRNTRVERKQIKFLWSFQRDVYGYGVYLTITHFLNESNRVSREHFFPNCFVLCGLN